MTAAYLQSHYEHTFTAPHAVVYLHSALSANTARNYEEFCGSFKIGEGLYKRLALVSDFIVLSTLISEHIDKVGCGEYLMLYATRVTIKESVC